MRRGICIALSLCLIAFGVSPELLAMPVPSQEAGWRKGSRCNLKSDTEISVYGGGYHGDQSSFFSGGEDFMIELVEFYLFLVMLGYVVGYTEWIPWEKDKK